MSLDGNGSYTPPAPQFPAIPNTVIYADDFNQIILDIATALSTAIFRDGQAAFTANQSMGGHKLTKLANGANPQDATTVLQVFTDPVFLATTVAGFKITGSMFQALMTTINLVASGTVTLTGATLLDMSSSMVRTNVMSMAGSYLPKGSPAEALVSVHTHISAAHRAKHRFVQLIFMVFLLADSLIVQVLNC